MKLRRLLALICAFCIVLTLTACGLDEGEIALREIELKEKSFKSLGRVHFDDGMIYCALSGTGVEFTFKGTECTVTIKGDDASTNSARFDDHARVAIYLNGERVVDDIIDNAVEAYPVFKSEDPIEATIKIVKLSESAMSTFAISGITVNGTAISPTENKEYLIEFVGDSITCGYGVDDEDMNHHFSTRTEDNTKTYAYKTAELLDADYSMVSFSGYGIISGYSDGTNKVTEQTVPQFYDKLGYSWSSNGSFVPSDVKWKFKRQPDVVVVNLGTNDNSYCQHIPERCEEYQQEYVNFLKDIRKHNPDATIIGTLGIMGQDLYPYVEAAVKQYSEDTGDRNVYSMMFDNQSMADGIAADWHPSERTHAKAADKLAEKIKEIMGW